MLLQELETKEKILKENMKERLESGSTSQQIKAKEELLNIEKQIVSHWEYLTPFERVYLARKKNRPKIREYIEVLFTEFFEQKGDRLFGNDQSIIGGIALYKGNPVTVLGTNKGSSLEENIECQFGMPQPDGYRKALRIMKQAQKFRRPIITFVDTPGAYPGLEAEERGQGEAIARCLAEMSKIKVPILTIVTGEGGSGGALALSVSNFWVMLENSVYSILSPEGFASILWKDSTRAEEASALMKLTASDLKKAGIVDEILVEGIGGASQNKTLVFSQIDQTIEKYLSLMATWSEKKILEQRKEKFRQIGVQ